MFAKKRFGFLMSVKTKKSFCDILQPFLFNHQIMRTDFAPFLAWATERGISTPLKLESDGNYRKLVLPDSPELLMSPSNSNYEIVSAPTSACIVGNDWETLVDKLKFEKSLGDKSEYAPWLELFPTVEDFSAMPRFWSEERLEFVKRFDGGQLQTRVEMDKLRFNEVDDQWALAVVDSRSNFLPDNTYSITPMLDMLNHDARVKTTARIDDDKRLLLEVSKDTAFVEEVSQDQQAQKNDNWANQLLGGLFGGLSTSEGGFRPGKEVLVSYGNFDNVETLCNYGFVAPFNVCNMETIQVRAMRKAPVFIVVDSSGSIDNIYNQMSLDSLRFNLMTEQEKIDLQNKSAEDDSDDDGKISERNEIEVYALVAGELDEAAYQAKQGISEADDRKDAVVKAYLQGRYQTLQKGIDWLKEKYPDLF